MTVKMSEIIIKDFCFEHLDLFEWRDCDKETYNIGSEFIGIFANLEKAGRSLTGIYEGRILGIGGIVPLSQKTGYCFTAFSKYADLVPLSSARTARKLFEGLRKDMGMHRLVTYNRLGATNHDLWCEWLGFSFEGYALAFDDEGNDYKQFAWVNKNGR